MYFYIDYINSKILIVFFLLIYIRIMISKKSITSKLICGYKFFEVKNKNNLVNKKLLLFAANFTIGNLSI